MKYIVLIFEGLVMEYIMIILFFRRVIVDGKVCIWMFWLDVEDKNLEDFKRLVFSIIYFKII